ncbi:MAG: response regulator [Myxococcota bacterium]
MRVLVVDDEAGKREQVVALLRGRGEAYTVDEARSFQTAMESLKSKTYDWVILDMRLTSFDVTGGDDGWRPRNFGGEEVLRKMTRRAIRSKVVVLTQYSIFHEPGGKVATMEMLVATFRSKYPSFVGLVQFQHSNNSWQERLLSMLSEGAS